MFTGRGGGGGGGDVMLGVDPLLMNWRAAVASISLLSFGSLVC